MSAEMDWSHDYCLSCDTQISEGAYCSQACRLADLEKAAHAESLSPLSTSASSTASYASRAVTTNQTQSGFYLPPAVNFSTYNTQRTPNGTSYPQQSSPSHSASNYSYYSPPSPTYYNYASSQQDSQTQQKRLSASSSHSSLTSASGHQSAQAFSYQTASALQGYMSSFDQVRETKRRQQSS